MKLSSGPQYGGGQPYAIPTRHPVTPEMEKAAAALKRTPAPKFLSIGRAILRISETVVDSKKVGGACRIPMTL